MNEKQTDTYLEVVMVWLQGFDDFLADEPHLLEDLKNGVVKFECNAFLSDRLYDHLLAADLLLARCRCVCEV